MRLLFAMLVTTLFIGCSAAPRLADKDISTFSDSCLTLLDTGNFLALSRNFHLPSTVRISERSKFHPAIEEKLKKTAGIYGKFEIIEQLDSNKSYLIYKTSVGSANHKKFWGDIKVHNSVYKVIYENIGEGYLITSSSYIKNKLELKEIKFGIHVNAPNSQEKFNKIISQLR